MNILLIEVVVLIQIGWATTLCALKRKWMRERQAWQWWQTQQTLQSHHTAEYIRDGLLQQTFAFRRYLEITDSAIGAKASSAISNTSDRTTNWLEKFQTFYQSLETLSDKLSPPFITDSLPLALQFTLKNWQPALPLSTTSSHLRPNVQLNYPSHWPQSSPQQNQVILSIVTALLELFVCEGNLTEPLSLTLRHKDFSSALTLEIINDPNQPTSKFSEPVELQHLKEIFYSLTAGQLEISRVSSSLTISLHWRADASSLDKG